MSRRYIAQTPDGNSFVFDPAYPADQELKLPRPYKCYRPLSGFSVANTLWRIPGPDQPNWCLDPEKVMGFSFPSKRCGSVHRYFTGQTTDCSAPWRPNEGTHSELAFVDDPHKLDAHVAPSVCGVWFVEKVVDYDYGLEPTSWNVWGICRSCNGSFLAFHELTFEQASDWVHYRRLPSW